MYMDNGMVKFVQNLIEGFASETAEVRFTYQRGTRQKKTPSSFNRTGFLDV